LPEWPVGAGETGNVEGAESEFRGRDAEALPGKESGFRPHPESMDFGALMSHIATTNYQFCAGLKDDKTPGLPTPMEKEAVVKFLADSFTYCGEVIPKLTEVQLSKAHNPPDGHLPGREILLAM